MGLDWMLNDRARPGREEEFDRLKAIGREFTEEERQRYHEVAVSPEETLGCPRIGIDEAATRHFLEVILPSHRRAAESRPDGDAYKEHWNQPDDVLLAEAMGAYATDLMEYKLSTVTGIIGGATSFRGKIIGYSELLPEDLRNEAYGDMDPEQMADYADRIEREAIVETERRLLEAGCPTLSLDAEIARAWGQDVIDAATERARATGFEYEEWLGWCRKGANGKRESFEYTLPEETAWALKHVLDAARWLRFWAEKGHSMYAWN